jgi:Dolichyl-phosphate-mannose-protein mannosyltransferase/PA14 domain
MSSDGGDGGVRGSRWTAWLLTGAIALYVVALAVLLSPAGGLLGHYGVRGPDGRILPVYERVDASLDFEVPQRIDAAYIFHWDMKRLGFPATMPPAVVRWEGLLLVPESGVYGFALEAQGDASLRLDGSPLVLQPDAITERPLQAGAHRIEVDDAVTQGEAHLVLRWRPPGGRLRPIPSSHLAVDLESRTRAHRRRTAGWILLALGAGSGLALFLLGRRPGSRTARWTAVLAGERHRLALGCILILAALLRFHDYALVPFHHETADEYQHAWDGWHLLSEGVPAAWSTFPDRYPASAVADFRWFGDPYVLVKPYFDHPPLFSVLVGIVDALAGAPSFLSCRLPVMRLVPITLSLLGLLLLVRLCRAYGAGERAALLAALVYAVTPVVVLAQRLVKSESLLALLFMGAILAVRSVEQRGRTRDAILAGVLCGLSLWTKATGIAVLGTVLALLLARRRWRAAAIASGITVAFVGLYLLYAWHYDFGIFLKVIEAQSTTKWVSLDSISDLLSGKVVVRWFGAGFYAFLMVAAAVVALRERRDLLIPLVLYGMTIALTADHRVIYGWYRIPLYPFLCVAAGLYLDRMLQESDLAWTLPFSITAVLSGLIYALPASWTATNYAVALFVLLAIGPFLLRAVLGTPGATRMARLGGMALLLIFVLCSVATVGDLLDIYSATRGVR